MRVELHCHSTASDGTDSPGEVVRRAADRGVELVCLTDHDTCAGWLEAAAAAAARSIRAIRGVELSTSDAGKTVHLLIYDVSGNPAAPAAPTIAAPAPIGADSPARPGRCAGGWADLEARLVTQARHRRERMREMLARLSRRGVPVELGEVEAEARGAVLGRPHLARALVRRGAASSVSEAFDRWLGDGGPADVPLDRFAVGEALALARAAGARVSLAHPHTLGPVRAADLVRRHRDQGLDGLEALYAAYGPRDRADWLAIARELRVAATGGSDYHGDAPDLAPGVELAAAHAAPLRDWLAV